MEPDNLLAININQDVNVFKQFFGDFYPSVCIFARKYLKDAELAEDLAQEAFVEYWERKENFSDIKAIKGYIYTVTRNKCLNQIKLNGIRENILNKEFSGNTYFYEQILEEETYRIVHQAVDKLAPQTRKIVLLSMEGNKNQDIAEQLRISVNTIKTLKKNAYKDLRILLKDYVYLLFLLSSELI